MILLKTLSTYRYEVSQKRLAICDGCEHFSINNKKCNHCGCFLEYKTAFLSAECPIGKWLAAEEPKDEDV